MKIQAHTVDARGVYLFSSEVDPYGPQPPGAIYDELPTAQGGHTRIWQGEWVQVLDADVPPAPVEFEPVPAAVTMRQARLALLGAGLLAGIDAAINALPSPQKEAARIEWEYAAEVQRSSGLVPMMGAVLGLDDAALDALFIEAEGL